MRLRMWGLAGRGPFLSGHDRKALHERVARVGTVHQLVEWFDRTPTERAGVMASDILGSGQARDLPCEPG
ncbi:hypothetical protein ACFWUW_17140 [Streptomyces sp. NPDC058655]|uniref:hypothetical protein n=1 Tax=unclassified Streptomyces TaxID=2593676 RepID=UPI00366450B2